jgi:N-acetylmuramoyl-L-alanine amidase
MKSLSYPRRARSGRRVVLWLLLCSLAGAQPAIAQIDIWIDSGHGGNDPGAPGFNGSALPNEKELNFAVAGYFENDITALGYYAYRIANYDTTYFPPAERRDIANGDASNDQNLTASCRLLVSIHMNSSTNASAFGSETYYATIKSDAKKKTAYRADSTAAAEIHADFMTYADVAFLFCSNDRGIKPKNYAILKGTKGQALLFELCFISNSCQWTNIITTGDQAFLADGIAAGVSQHLPILLQTETASEINMPNNTPPIVSRGQRTHVMSLQEGFDGTTFPPTGWTTQTTGLGVPYVWHRTTDPLYVGVGAASALVGGESPGAVDEWLISPGMTLSAGDNAIRFSWSGSQIWAGVLEASLNVREVGNMTWTPLWTLSTDEPVADPFIYRERVVDVTSWIGLEVEFGFRVVGTDGADFAIDAVEVGDFVPTTAPSNDVCASASTLSGTFSVQGVTCYAANDLDPYTSPPASCVGGNLDGPDIFFEIDAAWGDSLFAIPALKKMAGFGDYRLQKRTVSMKPETFRKCKRVLVWPGSLYEEDGRVLARYSPKKSSASLTAILGTDGLIIQYSSDPDARDGKVDFIGWDQIVM